ncbi:uncharacterized protein [Procambarus clarkii]|uniref:uncharacterized protein n=1 Tax=Procambarus clarkii TaxID=6728 RepID=UPI003743FB3E
MRPPPTSFRMSSNLNQQYATAATFSETNCRRTGWRGRQTPIAPTHSAHNFAQLPSSIAAKVVGQMLLDEQKIQKAKTTPETITCKRKINIKQGHYFYYHQCLIISP